MKPRIVLSGVNLVDMGPLSIYRDALKSLVEYSADRYEVIALVNSKELLDVPGVVYREFPEVKKSWWRRLEFEKQDSLRLSKELKPVLWLAMHDLTPNVRCRQVVYCHNPSPFYTLHLKDFRLDWRFALFCIFYGYLYRIRQKRNSAIIVQQQWIREQFEKHYHAKNVIVAYPQGSHSEIAEISTNFVHDMYRFIYPAYPRTYKNHGILLEAVRRLEERGLKNFELIITVSPEMNEVAKELYSRYSSLKCVRWIGSISRESVFDWYRKSNALVFPSLLETWGLPITEFKATEKPLIAIDLPYSRETVGDYVDAHFFPEGDVEALCNVMQALVEGTAVQSRAHAQPISEPFAPTWESLWAMLLSDSAGH